MDGITYRPMREDEVTLLRVNGGCWSADWSRVHVVESFGPDDTQYIQRCSFHGTVYVGAFGPELLEGAGAHRLGVRQGLYDTAFHGTCYLASGCHVSKTVAVNNVRLGSRGVVMSCGTVSFNGNNAGAATHTLHISVGPETGGRELVASAGMHYADLCGQLFGHRDGAATTSNDPTTGEAWTVIGPGAQLIGCNEVLNSQVGPAATVSGSSLNGCVLLSTAAAPVTVTTGAQLTRCILGEACVASNGCVADTVFMCERSALGDMARVVQSVLAPDAAVAGGGECHHSVLGPFVGFHHQSLLIAAVWPMGRGNVAYGAKVGANHTGRVNDQECWPGEGVFYGLGSLVKFPSSLVEAPYSIVVPGTVLTPQKISCPFSLIGGGGGGGGAGDQNVLKPGWVLYGNPYMVDRAAKKFAGRRRAVHHATDFPLVRPSLVDLVRAARRGLDVSGGGGDGVPTVGAGQCLVTSRDRARGVAAYTAFVRLYALQGALYAAQVAGGDDRAARDAVAGAVEAARPSPPMDAMSALRTDLELYRVGTTSSSSSGGGGGGGGGGTAMPPRPAYLTTASNDPATLRHQLAVLAEEFPAAAEALRRRCGGTTPGPEPALVEAFQLLVALATEHATAVRQCRERDGQKGRSVIADYDAVNAAGPDAMRDAVVADALARARGIEEAVGRVMTFQETI